MLSKVSTYELFKEYAAKAAEKFRQLDRRKTIRLISHIDSDGISAAAILVRTLNKLGFRYSLSIVNNLDRQTVDTLANEVHSHYVFADLGSGQLKAILSKFSDKKVFILDHHIPENAKLSSNIVHVNPLLFNIDGSHEISGSGVVYLFCAALSPDIKQMAHIAVVGAIGDQQENGGFLCLNNEILNEAVLQKRIEIEKGVRFFGRQTRPLHKLLEYSTDPYIPGVSGSSNGAIKLLEFLKIPLKQGSNYRKIFSLHDDEMKRLIKGIIKKRKNERNPKDIFGSIYTLIKEEKGSPLRDVKEFSTLLNACGRLGKASLGIGVCLNDKKSKAKAVDLLKSYKKELLEAIRWYEKNKGTEHVFRGQKCIIINAKAYIMPTLVGTLASILSNSSETEKTDYIMTMAQNVDATTKISLRYAGKNPDVDLLKILAKIMSHVEGETGGHKQAAGAVIPTSCEDEFISRAKRIFGAIDVEEKVKECS